MVTKKDKFLAAAQKFLEKGSLEKALAEFQKAAQEDPKDTRTWLRIAEIQVKRGGSDQAVQVYLKTADLYVEQGFFQRAVAVYKNVIKLSPGYVEAHFKLADIFKQLGLFSDAVQQYEQAANVHQKAGRLKEAIAALTQIVEINPEQVMSRIKLAELASQAGMNDEAIREFGRAADQLEKQGKIDEYLRVAERLLFHESGNLALTKKVARRYIERQNARFALAKLQQCFNADAKDPETLDLLATAFEQLAQIPKTVSVLKELAKVFGDSGRTHERNEVIKRILSLAPDDPEAAELSGHKSYQATPRPPASPPTSRGEPPASGGQIRRPSMVMPLDGPPRRGTNAGSFDAVAPSITFGMMAIPQFLTDAAPAPQPDPVKNTGERAALAEQLVAHGESDLRGEIQRIVNESDVFVKYGLVERAVDHLRRVFDIDPHHVGARERLVAVLIQLSRTSEAAAELEVLADGLRDTRPAEALVHAKRALELDPSATRARRLVGQVGPSATAGSSNDLVVELDVSGDDEFIEVEADVEEERSDSVLLEMDNSTGYEDVQLSGPGTQRPIPAPNPAAPVEIVDDDLDGGFEIEVLATSAEPVDLATMMSDLAQIDFFLEQGMAEEAVDLLAELDPRYADRPEVADRRQKISAATAALDSAVPVATGYENTPTVPMEADDLGPRSLTPVAVVAGGGDADASTHNDLGIAYKEMGLFDAAIKEFTALGRDPAREVFSLAMIGECHESKGQPAEALVHYKKALNRPSIKDDEATQLYFQLGRVFDSLGDRNEALYFLEKVMKRNPAFEDVSKRVASLRAQGGAPAR